MRPAWAGSYLQIPFLEHGRTRAGLDCYGLVRLVFQEQRGIELPSLTHGYATTTDADEILTLFRGELLAHWQEVPTTQARLFDVAIFRILGQPIHFALALDPPWFLHVVKDTDVSIERWDALIWEKRLVGMVRWQE
jgi:cell wall-associated NlpC family hydrolase